MPRPCLDLMGCRSPSFLKQKQNKFKRKSGKQLSRARSLSPYYVWIFAHRLNAMDRCEAGQRLSSRYGRVPTQADAPQSVFIFIIIN